MKKCLVTGGTGFLGSEIVAAMSRNGFSVTSIGRSSANTIQIDLSTEIPKISEDFELIIHCAGLAHYYPKSAADEHKFHSGHVNIAKNLVSSFSLNKPKHFIFISSVAVYGLDEGELISEDLAPNPNTPYGRSKLEAEQILLEWGVQNQIPVTVLRLPLVVGERAPGNLGRMVHAIKKGFYFGVRDCNPKKSVVLASDVARFIATAIQFKHGVYNLTDGHHPSLREIESCIVKQFKSKDRPPLLPFFTLKILGFIGDIFPMFPMNSLKVRKLTTSLTFSDRLARNEIGWSSIPIVEGWNRSE